MFSFRVGTPVPKPNPGQENQRLASATTEGRLLWQLESSPD